MPSSSRLAYNKLSKAVESAPPETAIRTFSPGSNILYSLTAAQKLSVIIRVLFKAAEPAVNRIAPPNRSDDHFEVINIGNIDKAPQEIDQEAHREKDQKDEGPEHQRLPAVITGEFLSPFFRQDNIKRWYPENISCCRKHF